MSTAAADCRQHLLAAARGRRIRTMREWAEQEIVIPDGPFKGRRYRCDRQPYAGLLLDAFDGGRWDRFVVTGSTQSGKTLTSYCIPCLYHLCEIGETVIAGVPDMRMAADKWRQDLLPVFAAAPRLRRLLPSRGAGSRGGKIEAVTLRNGATLRFMSGGGGDKQRAGFTARVLVVTETDGMDEAGEASREADKITQLEARTRAYSAATGMRKRVYLECTVSTEQGRTWREYIGGTQSRLTLPCPECGAWVEPDREHLVGWEDAEDVVAAREGGRFSCPACGVLWEHAQRREALARLRVLHRGQEIDTDTDEVVGEEPRTDTLGFRWHAAHNAFVDGGDVAADEWRAQRNTDREAAEREMCQYVWARPHIPDVEDISHVDASAVSRRSVEQIRGLIPEDTTHLTAALDIGQYLCHWVLLAFRQCGQVHVVEYGRLEVPSAEIAVERALIVAMRAWRDIITEGWPVEGATDERRSPVAVWVDSGWSVSTDSVYAICRESGNHWRPILGHGAAQKRTAYTHPAVRPPPATAHERHKRGKVHHVGLRYYCELLPKEGLSRVHIDGDHWKAWLHKRLSTPVTELGAMTLHRGTEREHRSFSAHMAAERTYEELKGGKLLLRHELRSRINHWLDATYIACAAGHFAGWRLVERGQRAEAPKARTYPRAEAERGARTTRYPSGRRGGGGWTIGR